MMVARIRRESGRTISGRGQVRVSAVLEIITTMKKPTRKVEEITKWAKRNSTRKGFNVITVRNGNILQMNVEIKGFQELAQDENFDSDKVLLMETTNSEEDSVNLWYLDTGCSNHMIGHREWFVNIDDKVKNKIKFADNSSVTTEDIGKVMIQRKDGQHSFINDVLYVPNMKNNWLSLGQLLEKGYSMRLRTVNGRCLIAILKAPLSRNRTFKIGIQIAKFQCLTVSISDESWMWHHRFGHLNFRSLSEFKSKKMVHGLPQIEIPKQLCVECCVSKQPRNFFKSEISIRSKRKLEVIYSYMCGPFEVKFHSLGGASSQK